METHCSKCGSMHRATPLGNDIVRETKQQTRVLRQVAEALVQRTCHDMGNENLH